MTTEQPVPETDAPEDDEVVAPAPAPGEPAPDETDRPADGPEPGPSENSDD